MNGRFEFHAGELAIQDRAGESAIAHRNGVVMAAAVIAGELGDATAAIGCPGQQQIKVAITIAITPDDLPALDAG